MKLNFQDTAYIDNTSLTYDNISATYGNTSVTYDNTSLTYDYTSMYITLRTTCIAQCI